MNTFYKSFAIAFISILLFSCSSGYKALKKGDYYKATVEAVEKLRDNSHSEKAQYVLLKAYPLAQKAALREIEFASTGNEQNKYEIIVAQYERLNYMAEIINNCPMASELVKETPTYPSELSEAKINAAEEAYDMGLKALNAGTFTNARLAYQYFIKANKYNYGYKDVLNLINESKEAATLHVVLEQPLLNANYQVSPTYFYDKLASDMMNTVGARLIRYYTFNEAESTCQLRVNQYISIDFRSFAIGEVTHKKQTINMKRDSVPVYEKGRNGETKVVYITAKAQYINNLNEIPARGIITVSIYSGTNKLVQQQTYSHDYVWSTEWGKYYGDDRALTEQQRKMCRLDPQPYPENQWFFDQCNNPLYTKVLTYLKSYYKKY